MIYCIIADISAQISVVHLLGDSVVWCISSSIDADQAGREVSIHGDLYHHPRQPNCAKCATAQL